MSSPTTDARPPIVVVGRQRSGTTVFHHLLASRSCRALGEVFHPNFKDDPDRFFWHVYQQAQKDPECLHPLQYLRLFQKFLADVARRHDGQCVSLDVKYNGLQYVGADVPGRPTEALKAIHDQGMQIVHIFRRNKLRLIVSEHIAAQTGAYQSTTRPDISLTERRVRISPAALLALIEREIAVQEDVAARLVPFEPVSIAYEDMFIEPGVFAPDTIAQVNAMTGSLNSNAAPDIALKRQNPEPLDELLDNYDEVSAALAETPYAWMLGEPEAAPPESLSWRPNEVELPWLRFKCS